MDEGREVDKTVRESFIDEELRSWQISQVSLKDVLNLSLMEN